MPPVKSLARSVQKWTRQSAAAAPEYEAGVRSPRKDWQGATLAANDAYKKGVTAAVNEDRFAAGVNAATTAGWQKGAIEKGLGRWPEGIRLSADNYSKGFEPYRQVIEATTLPPRGPKGDPANIQRVAVLASALHSKKRSLRGGK